MHTRKPGTFLKVARQDSIPADYSATVAQKLHLLMPNSEHTGQPQGPDIGDVRRLLPVTHDEYPIYVVCSEDAQEVAWEVLNRELTDAELAEVRDTMCLDWRSEIEAILTEELKLKRAEK